MNRLIHDADEIIANNDFKLFKTVAYYLENIVVQPYTVAQEIFIQQLYEPYVDKNLTQTDIVEIKRVTAEIKHKLTEADDGWKNTVDNVQLSIYSTLEAYTEYEVLSEQIDHFAAVLRNKLIRMKSSLVSLAMAVTRLENKIVPLEIRRQSELDGVISVIYRKKSIEFSYLWYW